MRMTVRHLNESLCCIILVMLAAPVDLASAEPGLPCPPRPYALNRADQEYHYLSEPACHTDFWDRIK
jgi:hypothetical protein